MSVNFSSKILDKRLSKEGVQEYLVQLKNSLSQTTEEWKESKEIQEFERLFDDFNHQFNDKTMNGTNGLSNGINGTVNGNHEEEVQSVNNSTHKPNGFDRGFRPFKILGAKNDDKNGLMFLVMFREDMTSADLIPNHILHQKCPQLLIKYYEKNTLWKRY